MTPANITRVRADLPAGYEVADLNGPLSAASLWGFQTGWTAEPPQCAVLADPVPADGGVRGLSASGSGGTIFVVAAGRVALDPGLTGECDRWTMTFAHTSAEVARIEAPAIEGADTLAWQAVARTVVESGSETITNASTAVAFLDHHVALVTVVTDPGSTYPPLDSGFAARLLADAVAALRG